MKTPLRPAASNYDQAKAPERGALLLVLELPSDPKLLSVVRAAVGRLAEILGFPAAQCRSITRAVDEALSNILRHCYGNRPGQPIALYFRSADRRQRGQVRQGLEILLRDRGPKVDSSKLRGRPLGDIRPGGLGLHFIHQTMDTIEFTRRGPTNQLRLVKYLKQKKNIV